MVKWMKQLYPIGVTLGLTLCGTVQWGVQRAAAQNFSGLQGKELTRVSDVSSAVGNLLGGLLHTSKGLKGSLDEVKVLEDFENRLVLEITFTGYDGAYLHGEVQKGQGEQRETIEQIRAEPLELKAGTSPVKMVVQLDRRASKDTKLESTFLLLRVAKSRRSSSGIEFTYRLPKRWQVRSQPENQIITVYAKRITNLQDVGYQAPPAQLETEGLGDWTAKDDMTQLVYLKHQKTGKYLVAKNGGGDDVVFGARNEYGATFLLTAKKEIGGQEVVVLKTQDNWHYLKIDPSGHADARTTEPSDDALLALESGRTYDIFGKTKTIRLRRAGQPNKYLTPKSVSDKRRHRRFSQIVVGAVDNREIDFELLTSSHQLTSGAEAAHGPSNKLITPGDLLRAPGFQVRFADILNVFPNIYQDRNPASGVFYFLPNAYYLSWNPEQGYLLAQHAHAGAGGKDREVIVTATLDPGIGAIERRAASVFVYAYAKEHGLTFTELRPVPIRDDESRTTIASYLQSHYNIYVDRVQVLDRHQAGGAITVEWSMDARQLPKLVEALTNAQGVSTDCTLLPEADGFEPQQVSMRIKLDDARTYGPIRWENNTYWHNDVPYPVQFKYLRTLVLDRNLRPTVLTWDLSSTLEIPPNARASFGPVIPASIREAAFYTWVEYSVNKDEAYPVEVLHSSRATVSEIDEVERSEITVHTLNPLEETGAFEIDLAVKSRFFDASARQAETRELVLDRDKANFTLPFYLDGDSNEVPFEYKLSVIMPDGTEHVGHRWMPGNRRLRVIIGSKQIREALGYLPREDGKEN